MRELKVGDIVKLKCDCLGNAEGDQGVVFEVYHLDENPGVQVIFENGEYDGFSSDDQQKFLERSGHERELAGYKFKNVMQLSRDYEAGMFDVVFN
jgi:hypothetical protein